MGEAKERTWPNATAMAAVILEAGVVAVNGIRGIVYTIDESNQGLISLSLPDTLAVFPDRDCFVARESWLDYTKGGNRSTKEVLVGAGHNTMRIYFFQPLDVRFFTGRRGAGRTVLV